MNEICVKKIIVIHVKLIVVDIIISINISVLISETFVLNLQWIKSFGTIYTITIESALNEQVNNFN